MRFHIQPSRSREKARQINHHILGSTPISEMLQGSEINEVVWEKRIFLCDRALWQSCRKREVGYGEVSFAKDSTLELERRHCWFGISMQEWKRDRLPQAIEVVLLQDRVECA